MLHTILDATVKAAGGLCLVGIAWLVYQFGRRAPEYWKPQRTCYATMFGIAAFLGFMAAFNLGTHVENDDDDPINGRGRVVEDYKPAESQRLEEGVKTFVEVGVLLVAGARRGFRERS